MKAERINLNPSVRRGLIAAGVSTVKVVSAVNSYLGEIKLVSAEGKTGAGRIGKDSYKTTVTGTYKYEGPKNIVATFDAWHSAVEKMEKIASVEVMPIPPIFDKWLAKFKANAAEVEAENADLAAEAKVTAELNS